MVSKLEVYLALTPQWQRFRDIRRTIKETRKQEKRCPLVSRPGLALTLSNLIDEGKVEGKIEPVEIYGQPVKQYFYRITADGYNDRARQDERNTVPLRTITI